MKRWSFVFLSWLCCAGAVSLRAVQMEPLSIEQLARDSTLVLRGTVRSKSCQRDPAGRIYTKVELEVADVWKGELSTNRFTVVHGGGVLGVEKAAVSGQVEYGIGEEVVAFLVINQRGEGVTLGLAQGKFHVAEDPETGELVVHNLFHGGPDDADVTTAKMDHPSTRRLTLAELRRRVRGGQQ